MAQGVFSAQGDKGHIARKQLIHSGKKEPLELAELNSEHLSPLGPEDQKLERGPCLMVSTGNNSSHLQAGTVSENDLETSELASNGPDSNRKFIVPANTEQDSPKGSEEGFVSELPLTQSTPLKQQAREQQICEIPQNVFSEKSAPSSGKKDQETARTQKHQRLESLPPHIQYVGHIRRRNSPGSNCGDLEAPSPRPARRSPLLESCSGLRHAAQSPVNYDRGRRSQSQTSNISRKRSKVHKSRAREDSGHKQKILMEQVAQRWNECLQLAEEEKELAIQEIGRLQGDMDSKCRELIQTRSLLSQSQTKINKIESRCESSEEQQKAILQQNEDLTGEIQSLRVDLSNSEQRAAQADEKNRAYKVKINEAIQEQQDLYKRSKTYCDKLLAELEQEKDVKNTKVEEISKYLNLSRQKRAQLQQLHHEFQEQAEVEAQKSRSIISTYVPSLTIARGGDHIQSEGTGPCEIERPEYRERSLKPAERRSPKRTIYDPASVKGARLKGPLTA